MILGTKSHIEWFYLGNYISIVPNSPKMCCHVGTRLQPRPRQQRKYRTSTSRAVLLKNLVLLQIIGFFPNFVAKFCIKLLNY